jgi:hypothetical protein
MSHFSDVEDAIQLWAETYGQCPAIWKHQNAPQPARPYIVLHIENTYTEGDDFEDVPNADETHTIYGDRELHLSVRYLGNEGDDATFHLMTIIQTLYQIDVRAALRLGNVIVLSISRATDMTFLEQDHQVERADADVRLRTSLVTTYGGEPENMETQEIEHVEIEHTYEPDGTEISQEIDSPVIIP